MGPGSQSDHSAALLADALEPRMRSPETARRSSFLNESFRNTPEPPLFPPRSWRGRTSHRAAGAPLSTVYVLSSTPSVRRARYRRTASITAGARAPNRARWPSKFMTSTCTRPPPSRSAAMSKPAAESRRRTRAQDHFPQTGATKRVTTQRCGEIGRVRVKPWFSKAAIGPVCRNEPDRVRSSVSSG